MVRLCLAAVAAVFVLFGVSAPAQARIEIRVDLASQRMLVTTPDGESFNWAISSGRQGYRTPNGVYRAQRLERNWYSRKYGGAMPNAIFFRGGYAIHATGEVGRLGRPASHGCIRLHPANAAKLFQLVKRHGMASTRIAINGVAPDSNSQFAKAGQTRTRLAAKPATTRLAAKPATAQQAKLAAKRNATDWATARGRVLERDTFFDPGAALGFRPLQPMPQRLMIWR